MEKRTISSIALTRVATVTVTAKPRPLRKIGGFSPVRDSQRGKDCQSLSLALLFVVDHSLPFIRR